MIMTVIYKCGAVGPVQLMPKRARAIYIFNLSCRDLFHFIDTQLPLIETLQTVAPPNQAFVS